MAILYQPSTYCRHQHTSSWTVLSQSHHVSKPSQLSKIPLPANFLVIPTSCQKVTNLYIISLYRVNVESVSLTGSWILRRGGSCGRWVHESDSLFGAQLELDGAPDRAWSKVLRCSPSIKEKRIHFPDVCSNGNAIKGDTKQIAKETQ